MAPLFYVYLRKIFSYLSKMSGHKDNDRGLDRMDLVSWTLGNHDYDQSRKIYIDPDNPQRSITAAEARRMVRELVAGFKAVGLQPGDCVCVHAFNDIMYTMLFLGIIGAGGRFTGSNPAYTSLELTQHIRNTKARFLITEPELLPRIALAIEACSLPSANVFVLDTTDRGFPQYYRPWKELLQHGETDWVRFKTADEAKHTTAALLSTSGTTGMPKAAMISHYSCVMQNLILDDSTQKPYDVSRIISLPEFHAFAFPISHVAPLREGIPTYIMRRFDLHHWCAAIHHHQIRETAMVPPMMFAILKASETARELLQSLRLVWCAGAPLSQTTQDQLYRLLKPSARILQVWGMTEAGWITTFLWPEKDHTGSVGRLLPGMEVKLVDENGNVIDRDNRHAEISVRGPLLMQGYLGNPEASRDALDEDGWLRTGDVGYRDKGKLYIVDRKKEMIKVRGWQVSPAELEAALLLHPNISDAAVVGTTLPGAETETEVPRGYIVKSPPHSELTEHDVREFMSTRLARYKNLDGGVVFVDSIPKSSAGKILRKALKDRARIEVAHSAEINAVLATDPAPAEHETALSSASSDTELDGRSRATSHATTSSTHSNVTTDLPKSSHLVDDIETKEGGVFSTKEIHLEKHEGEQGHVDSEEIQTCPSAKFQDPEPSLPQTLPPMALDRNANDSDLQTGTPDRETHEERGGKRLKTGSRSHEIRA